MKNKDNIMILLERLKARENEKRNCGYHFIAGADEAGRGPLCGPVVAACVILPENSMILGVDDSKKLSEKKREQLYEEIVSTAVSYAIGIVDADVIDRINILEAARLAFKQAITKISPTPDYLFTDAISGLDIDIAYESVVKGDANIYSVAAASIIAKVSRDRILREYDAAYPEYGFAKHKGYGTKAHYEAILKYGVLPIHRRTFLKKLSGSIYENEKYR